MNNIEAPIRIVADDRENAGGVIEELRRFVEVSVDVQRLKIGDFLVEERFAVERKTLMDFAQSVIDGRLFAQATALAQGTRRGILVLEGASGDLTASRMSRESLQGALISVSVFFGLAVLRSRDAAETARLIVYLCRQAQRFAQGTLPRPGYRPKGKRARQLFILQGLPGIGPGRAVRLLDHFGSVRGVALASAEELAMIDGIGETTAEKIGWALEEPAGRYEV